MLSVTLMQKSVQMGRTLLGFFIESVLLSVLEVLAALGEVRPLERRSSLVGEALPSGLAVCFLRPLRSVDIWTKQQNMWCVLVLLAICYIKLVVKMVLKGINVRRLTEPRFRRVLMLCFPLSPSSSSLTGLNINGGGSTGFSMGGSSPYFLKWIRQSVHSRMFSRPPWCQSLEAVNTNLSSAELCLLNITLTGSALRLAKHLMDMLRSKKLFSYQMWVRYECQLHPTGQRI